MNTLQVAHLYGDLMNAYGDYGNILMLKHLAKKLNYEIEYHLISIGDEFDENKYDIVLWGGGQDYEQTIVAKDLPRIKQNLINYIEQDKVMLAICGGFQFLGHFYETSDGQKIKGISAIDYYTTPQKNNRFIGNVVIENENKEQYLGFENHQGTTFLGEGIKPLGRVLQGYGNNGQDTTEGVHYKNTYGTYFHGPILTRNQNLAQDILKQAIQNKENIV